MSDPVMSAIYVLLGIFVTAFTGALVQIYLDRQKARREGPKDKGDYAQDLQTILDKETSNHLDVIRRMEEQKIHYEGLLLLQKTEHDQKFAAQKAEYDQRIAALERQLDQSTNEYEVITRLKFVGANATIKENTIKVVPK